jgi:hypothetical protein
MRYEMFTEFELKLKADELYLRIHDNLSRESSRSRYRSIHNVFACVINKIKQECENEGIIDLFEQNAIILNMLGFLHDFEIDPSPENEKYREHWSAFVCKDQPMFLLIREATEVFDEWSLTIRLKPTIEYEYDLG